jgi:hypothetical protein
MAKLNLVPECHAETIMVSKLFIHNHDLLNHAAGIHQVSNTLWKSNIAGYINVGFVDADKHNTPIYLDDFIVIEESACISLKIHPDTDDYLFVAKPAIEKFLFLQLEEIGKTPSDFELPNDFNKFKHQLKKSSIGTNQNYHNLLMELKTKNTSGIAFIQQHLATFRSIE